MEVDATEGRGSEGGSGEDLAVITNDKEAWGECVEPVNRFRIVDGGGLGDRELPLGGPFQNGVGRRRSFPRVCWGGSRDDVNDRSGIGLKKGVEGGHGKGAGPHQDEAKGIHDEALISTAEIAMEGERIQNDYGTAGQKAPRHPFGWFEDTALGGSWQLAVGPVEGRGRVFDYPCGEGRIVDHEALDPKDQHHDSECAEESSPHDRGWGIR